MCVYLDENGVYWYVKQIAMHEHWILEMLYRCVVQAVYFLLCMAGKRQPINHSQPSAVSVMNIIVKHLDNSLLDDNSPPSVLSHRLCALCAGVNAVKSRPHKIAKLGKYLPQSSSSRNPSLQFPKSCLTSPTSVSPIDTTNPKTGNKLHMSQDAMRAVPAYPN